MLSDISIATEAFFSLHFQGIFIHPIIFSLEICAHKAEYRFFFFLTHQPLSFVYSFTFELFVGKCGLIIAILFSF